MSVTSGYLTSKVSSTVSSPAVHYFASYEAERMTALDKTVSVRLTFGAWLNSAASKLGTGIRLTIFARVNGGAWYSAVIKDRAESWSGTAVHTASLTLSTDTAENSAKIEFYVSRTGSSYSGSAGTLGSAANPKSYSAALPASTSTTTVDEESAAVSQTAWIRVGGVWKSAAPYVRRNGVWQKAAPYVRVSGIWKAI